MALSTNLDASTKGLEDEIASLKLQVVCVCVLKDVLLMSEIP